MRECVYEGSAPVIIIGGGPVGLATALELAFHGVDSLVLERRVASSEFPMRANLVNLRSMEHFRRLGIADQLRDNDPVSKEFKRSSTWVTHLNGHIVYDFPNVFDFPDASPLGSDRPEWIPNEAIEKTLQDAASRNIRIDLRFDSTLIDFQSDESGISVLYRGGDGREQRVTGEYMVAADGSRSFVRKKLGLRMEGVSNLTEASIWHIEAPDMIDRSTVGKSSFFWYINEHRDSSWTIVQDSEKGRYAFMVLPMTEGFDPDSWEDAKRLLYRNVGFAFPVKNLGGGKVGIHSLILPRFDHGRTFFVGDAAHLISPMGGFGLNLGIGDAADLGWKLSARIRGWGGLRLLDSYGSERSTAIRWIQGECIDNTSVLAPELAEDGMSRDDAEGQAVRGRVAERIAEVKAKEFESLGGQLGYRYDDSPIIVDDDRTRPALSMGEYTPSAAPGARAPHIWLSHDESLFDRFGPEFTLLKLNSECETGLIEAAAAERYVPLKIVELDSDKLRDLYEANLALIRPDQHVAWRGDAIPPDAGRLIDKVIGA